MAQEQHTVEYVYELIDISWSLEYDFGQEDAVSIVEDDNGADLTRGEMKPEPLRFDDLGIPIENTKEAFSLRKKIISNFYHSWKEAHPEQQVYNASLREYILVRGISIAETPYHAASSYKSTRAVLLLDQILASATVYGYSRTKPEDKNQKEFDKLIVMTYKVEDIGTIKLTVGIRNKSHAKIQYSITVPSEDKPLIDPALKLREKHRKKTKK